MEQPELPSLVCQWDGTCFFIKHCVINSCLVQKLRQYPIRNIKATIGQQPSEHPVALGGQHFGKACPKGDY